MRFSVVPISAASVTWMTAPLPGQRAELSRHVEGGADAGGVRLAGVLHERITLRETS